MQQRHHWQVWAELPQDASQELKDALISMGQLLNNPVRIDGQDVILCEGSHTTCLKFYKGNRKASKVELHLGYAIPEDK